MSIKPSRRNLSGFTLIELIVFIVIVSVALTGILTVLNVTLRGSADPMIHKQMLAIGEAILAEVELQPFTWCDPDDPQAISAISNAVGGTGCTSAASVEGIGKETVGGTDARGSSTYPLDNVSDYNNETITTNINGSATGWPAGGYSATVAVANTAAATRLGGIATDADVLLITVTVAKGSERLVLQGYRTRYSPNSMP